MRLIALSAILSAVEVAIPYLDDTMPRGVFAVVAGVVSLSAGIARLVAQPEVHK